MVTWFLMVWMGTASASEPGTPRAFARTGLALTASVPVSAVGYLWHSVALSDPTLPHYSVRTPEQQAQHDRHQRMTNLFGVTTAMGLIAGPSLWVTGGLLMRAEKRTDEGASQARKTVTVPLVSGQW